MPVKKTGPATVRKQGTVKKTATGTKKASAAKTGAKVGTKTTVKAPLKTPVKKTAIKTATKSSPAKAGKTSAPAKTSKSGKAVKPVKTTKVAKVVAPAKKAAPAKKPVVKKAAKPVEEMGLSETLLQAALKVLDERQAEDIVHIDLRGKSPLADYAVIASGRSSRQLAAIAEYLREVFFKNGVRTVRVEGLPQADWVLFDGGDILVHLFRPEVRTYYKIEDIWSSTPPAKA